MKVEKKTDAVDLSQPVESEEFLHYEQFDPRFGSSMAVRFEQRFPVIPPMPTEPKLLREHPNFARIGSTRQQLSLHDWEWIRLSQMRQVELNKEDRIKTRDDRVIAEADRHLHTFYETALREQQFRILMTWMSRFKAERQHRLLRLEEHADFLETMRERRADNREFLRVDKFLVRRKKGLESPVPPPPVKYSVDIARAELEDRHHLATKRDAVSITLLENLRQAQIMTSSLLFKQQLDLQNFREERREDTPEDPHLVQKIKATAR
jgi:hypothetical protein